MDAEKKQLRNLYKKLTDNQNSVLFAADRLTVRLLRKLKASSYDKDLVFYKLFKKLESEAVDDEEEEEDLIEEPKVPFYTPFVEQRKDIDRSSALYTSIFSCRSSLFAILCQVCRRSKVRSSLRRFIHVKSIRLHNEN